MRMRPGLRAQDETGAAVHILTDPGSGVQMYARHWAPPGRPRAVVIITHGLSWHSAYFKVVVSSWVEQQGFAVIAYDLPGYGLSGSMTGACGWWRVGWWSAGQPAHTARIGAAGSLM